MFHRRLDHDIVVRSKLSAESNHRIPCELDPPSIVQSLTVKKHCHRKAAVHVESDNPHATLLWLILSLREVGGQHDTYGSALAAHPGKSQGRPHNNASSQLMRYLGLPRHVLPTPLSRKSQDTAGELSLPARR